MTPRPSPLLWAIPLFAMACHAADGHVSTIAGSGQPGFHDGRGGEAAFNLPGALAVATDGTIYVADTFNHAVRRVTPDGLVSTIAGTGMLGYLDGPGSVATFNVVAGIALDEAAQVLYVADSQNQLIRRIDLATGTVSTFAGAASSPGLVDGALADARFDQPYHLALDSASSTLWIADKQNNAVRAIDLRTATVRTVAGGGDPGFADGVGAAARFSAPSGVAVDGAGGVFVTDSPNTVIRHVSADGTVTTVAGVASRPGYMNGPASAARMAFPWGIAVAADGSVVFADRFNNVIRGLSARTVTTVVGSPWSGSSLTGAPPRTDGSMSEAVLWLPTAVAIGPSGSLFVTDASSLRRFDRSP